MLDTGSWAAIVQDTVDKSTQHNGFLHEHIFFPCVFFIMGNLKQYRAISATNAGQEIKNFNNEILQTHKKM